MTRLSSLFYNANTFNKWNKKKGACSICYRILYSVMFLKTKTAASCLLNETACIVVIVFVENNYFHENIQGSKTTIT